MSLLRETVNDYVVDRLESALLKMEKRCESIIFTYHRMLKEGVTDELPLDIEGSISELEKRLKAAWRGISILKKFPKNSESTVLHRRRIFDNIGKIKNLMITLMKVMSKQVSQDESETNGLNSGQPEQQMQAQQPRQTQPQFNQQRRVGESVQNNNLDVIRNRLTSANKYFNQTLQDYQKNPSHAISMELQKAQDKLYKLINAFEKESGLAYYDEYQDDAEIDNDGERERLVDIGHDRQDRAFR